MKKELRRLLKEKRKTIPLDELERRSSSLCSKLLESSYYQNAHTVFCFLSYQDEIRTDRIIRQALLENKTLCVPLVTGKGIMIASKISSLDDLVPNRYGIPEPSHPDPVSKQSIDLIIVPALAFSKDGYRIGYGGGFYDRYLADYQGITAGLVFREFLLDSVPREPHDSPVTILFTEE